MQRQKIDKPGKQMLSTDYTGCFDAQCANTVVQGVQHAKGRLFLLCVEGKLAAFGSPESEAPWVAVTAYCPEMRQTTPSPSCVLHIHMHAVGVPTSHQSTMELPLAVQAVIMHGHSLPQ